MPKVSLTVLGSSAGMPQSGRANSGYVLAVDGKLIQFDCGGGVSASFRRAGLKPEQIESIIISHCHPDHISELPLYVQMLYMAERIEPLQIYLPEEAIPAVKEYFRACYLMPEKLPFEIDFVAIPTESNINLGDITIKPIPNRHLQGYRQLIEEYALENKMQSYSYRINIDNKSILYSADLGLEDDLFPHLENINLLVVESTHIDLEHLLKEAMTRGVGQIVLTHFTESYDTEQALTLARKIGFDNLLIACDGMQIDI